MYKNKLTWIIKYLIIILVLLLVWGWSNKTKSFVIDEKVWNDKGVFQNTFINNLQNLQLAPETKKIISLKENSVIWDIYKDKQGMIISTGSKGKVYFFDNQNRLKETITLPAKEVTAIAKDKKNNIYLGSGPNGIIYRLDKNNKFKKWFDTKEQFIWDFKIVKNHIWVTTGGKSGKVFKLPLSQNPLSFIDPVMVFEEANISKIKFQGNDFFVSTSSPGKLYKVNANKKVEVLFDAGEKDIADFIFINKNIYLLTSGQGALIAKETTSALLDIASDENISLSPDLDVVPSDLNSMGAKALAINNFSSLYKNYLIKISQDYQISFPYHFENKNPVQLIYKKAKNKLIIGILENTEIYELDLKTPTKVDKIFFKENANLSGLILNKDKLFFAIANLGEIHQMSSGFINKGRYQSKVLDFKETAKWGNIHYQNYSINPQVTIYTRVGNSRNQGKYWSEWKKVKGKILSRPARFLQVAIELKSQGNRSPQIHEIKIFYGSQNQQHRIVEFKIAKQNNLLFVPEEDFTMARDGLLETYDINKSLNTDFSTVDKNLIPNMMNQGVPQLPFNNVGKKNFILSWKTQNPDQDILVYDIYYRQKKSSTFSSWKIFRKNYLNDYILLDGYKFIDGIYQFKLVAMDSYNNPQEEQFTHQAFSSFQIFDNQPPLIDSLKINKNIIKFKVKDKLSLIKSVKYTDDRKTVNQILPLDGVFDSLQEEFILKNKSKEIVLIIKDNADNILYYSLEK